MQQELYRQRRNPFRWLLDQANDHPTFCAFYTGLWGLILLFNGIFGLIVGVIFLGLFAYAAYDTKWWKNWKRDPDPNRPGRYKISGHVVLRWLAPLSVIAAMCWLLFILWIFFQAAKE